MCCFLSRLWLNHLLIEWFYKQIVFSNTANKFCLTKYAVVVIAPYYISLPVMSHYTAERARRLYLDTT